jgi:hypothetical protein
MTTKKFTPLFAVVLSLTLAVAAAAQTTVTVTPGDTQGWTNTGTTAGGMVSFIADSDTPLGYGALRLMTDDTTQAKATYVHATDTALADVTDLGYWTKQVEASFEQGTASYQLVVCLDGYDGETCNGFTTLVFEPYQNIAQGPVVNGVWQEWDVDEGQFWSSRTVDGAGSCDVTAGGGGAPFYTLAGLQTVCPNADVVAFGVNVGSNNPEYDIRVDGVQFNDTIYDFEAWTVPTEMQQCKGMGWRNVRYPDGTSFRNQGQCVSFVVRTQNGSINRPQRN